MLKRFRSGTACKSSLSLLVLVFLSFQARVSAVDVTQSPQPQEPGASVATDPANEMVPGMGDAQGSAAQGAIEPFLEPRHPHRGAWYLGVYGRYTTTGHLLTRVFPNTPASRAGLEPGDRIVTVNGQQVGDVLNRQYPIDMLLQRHASRDGLVRLLVQDQRTGRLVNLDLRLTRGEVHF